MLPQILIQRTGSLRLRLLDRLDGQPLRARADWHFTAMPVDAVTRAGENDDPYRIVVLDAESLPAFYAADAVREYGWPAHIIFVSRRDDLRLRMRAAKYNCAGFLLLPEQEPRLLSLIGAILENL